MKKFFTILIAGILTISGMYLNLDKHFCGGEVSDVKLSFSGKMASCGMEEYEVPCAGHSVHNQKCCADQVTVFNLTSNYLPSFCNCSTTGTGIDLPSPADFIIPTGVFSDAAETSWELPPGELIYNGITLSRICVFRI